MLGREQIEQRIQSRSYQQAFELLTNQSTQHASQHPDHSCLWNQS